MKIESSAVAMNSTRNYESIEITQIKSQEAQWQKTKPQDKHEKESDLTKLASETKKLLEDQQSQGQNVNPTIVTREPSFSITPPSGQTQSVIPSLQKFEEGQLSLIKKMLEMFFKGRNSAGMSMDISEQTQKTMQGITMSSGNSPSLAGMPGMWVKNVKASHFFSEQETTSFSSVGIAKTEDGRELTFAVDLQMSRSYMEYTEVNWQEEVVMRDPLVINLTGGATGLSDQKFFFDIDSDGKQDSISYLNKGSGFLALDKNGDGRINNGSELFGAKTGNGFAELSAYDTDNNGWIDENDEIYSKLKIWIKNDDNTDTLVDLKTADVGAIYLGNNKTDFTLKSAETGQVNGQVRRTGVYLKESTGMAQTVQQIDLSV